MKIKLLAAAAAISIAVAASPSQAALFDFTLTGTNANGGNVSGSGTFTTTDMATDGAYTITAISGMFNSVAIDSLLAPGSYELNDNLLFASTPYLDVLGVSFTLANNASTEVNIYYSSLNSAYQYFRTPNGSGTLTSFTVTPSGTAGAVPEPATWAMMVGGFGIVGFGMRRRSDRAVQAI